MSETEFSNIHAFIYHISNVSKSWTLTNPYSIALRVILLNDSSPALELRAQQEYHFLAKMILDENNKDNRKIKNNIKNLNGLLDDYRVNKKQTNGDIIIKRIFISFLLHLLNNSIHYNSLNKGKITEFLSSYMGQDNSLKEEHRILCLVFYVENKSIQETSIEDVDIALDLLYDRLLMCNSKTRTKEKVIDYYIKQQRLEKIDIENVTSELSMLKLLEVAVILKAASGKGLYLPELEKEQYLSNVSMEIVKEKYLTILNDSFSNTFYKIRLPSWFGYLILFAAESAIFLAPNIFDSVQFGPVAIKLSVLLSIPVWALLLGNGILVILYDKYTKKKLENKVKALKWK